MKGQLKIDPSTDFWSRFEAGETIVVQDRTYQIEQSSIHKNRPLLKLKGIDSIEAAEALKWQIVKAAGEPDLDDDEYLIKDLVGLTVFTEDGAEFGIVKDILHYPAHDILVVGETMIPMVKEFVKKIEPDQKRITVHLIPGMVSD